MLESLPILGDTLSLSQSPSVSVVTHIYSVGSVIMKGRDMFGRDAIRQSRRGIATLRECFLRTVELSYLVVVVKRLEQEISSETLGKGRSKTNSSVIANNFIYLNEL